MCVYIGVTLSPRSVDVEGLSQAAYTVRCVLHTYIHTVLLRVTDFSIPVQLPTCHSWDMIRLPQHAVEANFSSRVFNYFLR